MREIPLGRALSHPSSPGVLQRGLVLLGSENNDTSGTVRLSVFIRSPTLTSFA